VGARIQLSFFRAIAARIIVLAVLLPTTALHVYAADGNGAKPAPPIPWNKVSGSEQKVLTPLAKDWNQLSGTQQRRLITSAKQNSKLTPIQQERFQERLTDWAALTPQQRAVAREKFQDLSKLPPDKQHKLREKWSESKGEKKPPASTDAATGGAQAK
jgi:hypothetical protein